MSFFRRKRKGKVRTAKQRKPESPVTDDEETILINLASDEAVNPDDIRVVFDEPAERPPSTHPVTPARAAPADGATEIWTVGDDTAPVENQATDNAATGVVDLAQTAACLLVTTGAARGSLHPVRLGRNRVGRFIGNEIILRGDPAITGENHITVAADPKTRSFFAIPGDSTNLAYLNDEPLLEARDIEDGARIQLGDTHLVLVQLFGRYLDWD